MRRGLFQKFAAAGLVLGLFIAFAPAVSGAPSTPQSAAATPQLGIDVVVDNQSAFTTPQAMATAKELFSYVKSLGGNAVSLNFPFYMTSQTSSDPSSGAGTPSPARIADLAMLARGMGLQVQLRPYLSEADFPPPYWRGTIKPTDPAEWFARYWAFLRPYLVVAAPSGVSSFSIGIELDSMMKYLNDWIPLVTQARATFPGTIIYSEHHVPPLETLPGTQLGWDAYTPIPLPSGAQPSAAAFTKGDLANYQQPGFQGTPGETTLEEVGIAAAAGANLTPWNVDIPARTRVDRSLQVDWFTAACNAMWDLHMKGIYFWVLFLADYSPSENDTNSYTNWVDTPTATAIKSCFSRTS
ncbi:MAG: glycoside hydrolase family 113 [Acidimicrobiales bacterium]